MSGSRTEELLRLEIQELKQSLRHLSEKVERQEDRITELSYRLEAELQRSKTEEAEPVIEEVPGSGASICSYSEVSSVRVQPPFASSSLGPLRPEVEGYSWAFREQVARQIGEFLRRAVAGDHRQTSGRDQLRGLQSRLYIIVRDHSGRTTTAPVRVTTKFSRVKELCYKAGGWGDSVFVGVPTADEGRLAAETAGYSWPASFD